MVNFKKHLLFFMFLCTSILAAQNICSDGTAAYATAGNSTYKDQVLWLTWGGDAQNKYGKQDTVLDIGSKSSATFILAGKQMCFECEIVTKTAPSLKSYAPGSWSGDALDDMFRIVNPGSPNKNIMFNGIMVTGDTSQFTLSCSAKLDGQPYKIKGLVMADAESLNATSEYLKASAKGTWNIVEMNKKGQGAYNVSKYIHDGKNHLAYTKGNDSGAAAVSFLSFNPDAYAPTNFDVTIDFDIKGGGNTAIGIGLLVPNADGGDAPATYGEVFHLVNNVNITHDNVLTDSTAVNINQANYKPGAIVPPLDMFLGSVGPLAERQMNHSNDASADKTAAYPNEEDAWPTSHKIFYDILPGSEIKVNIPYTSTEANTVIAGWIDFNQNGLFDAGERTSVTFNGAGKGTAELKWIVPADFIKGKTFARLRIAASESDIATATGVANTGEVEDHQIFIDDPKFTLSKSSNANNNVWNALQADKKYLIEVTNIATVASYGTIKVIDVLPAGMKPNWQGVHSANGWNITYQGQILTATTTAVIGSNQKSSFDFPIAVDSNLPSAKYINKASVGGGGDNEYKEPVDPNLCDGTMPHCAVYEVQVLHKITAFPKNYGAINPYQFKAVSVLEENVYDDSPLVDFSKVSLSLSEADAKIILFNADGTFTVNPSAAAKTYNIPYTICEIGAHITNCSTETISFEVLNVKGPTTKGNEILDAPLNTEIKSKVDITVGDSPIQKIDVINKPTDVDITFDLAGNYTIKPGANYQGGDKFSIDYEVTDDNGLKATSTIIVNFESLPSIAVVKRATLSAANKMPGRNEQIEYAFEVTNTGNTTVENVIILDKLISENPIPVTPSVLKPQEKGTAVFYFPVQLQHYDQGLVTNSAMASATTAAGVNVTDISGTAINNDDAATTVLTQESQIALLKSAVFKDENANGIADLNETILYTFEVENTGNVTLTNIKLSDAFLNVVDLVVTPSTLKPGEKTSLSLSYVLTQADINAGIVVNSAEVTATNPKGDLVFDISGTSATNDEVTETNLQAISEISVIMTAKFLDDNNDGMAQIGETIVYSFSIKNTGATTLYNVELANYLPGIVLSGNPIIELKAGETNNSAYTATYQLELQDLKNGQVVTQVVVSSKTSQGNVISDLSDNSSYAQNAETITPLTGCVLEVFNAISPNGDGKNDFFLIQGIECYPDNTIEIYNRWGVLVYKTANYNNKDIVFNGFSDGRATVSKHDMLPVGTYFYILKFNDLNQKSHQLQGYLYLTR